MAWATVRATGRNSGWCSCASVTDVDGVHGLPEVFVTVVPSRWGRVGDVGVSARLW